MNKLTSISLRPLLLLSFLLLFINSSFPQNNYLMSIENGTRVNSNTFEFDVYIKATGTDFNLTSYQCAFTFDASNDGGTLNFSYISGSSQLSNIPSCGIGIYQLDGVRELTFASVSGNDIISATAKKVGRFRLQSTTAYTSSLFTISWNFQGIVNTILTDSDFNNIADPSFHSNFSISVDINPPTLLSAMATNAETVVLNFSEQISQSSANNAPNYAINNGITVNNAILSSNGTAVTLSTSPNTPGITYTVTVNNVKDLAGNLISPEANAEQYILEDSNPPMMNIKVFLQGPYNKGSMNKYLNTSGYIPLIQPFNTSPWNYSGSEIVQSIPTDVVDWVLIELRSATNGATSLIRRAAFVKTDGTLVDLDGLSKVRITGIKPGNYYVVINQRNHLAVMSDGKVELSSNPTLYDFTTASNKAYGNGSQIKLDNGVFGMYSGDGNGNGNINKADLNSVWKQQNGQMGYYLGDYDMNGGVNISDKNIYWKTNQGTSSNVPK
ncbi:MAG: Ig-like domain-containing protein [Ignavibacteriaceae bacterium]